MYSSKRGTQLYKHEDSYKYEDTDIDLEELMLVLLQLLALLD